MIDKVIFHYNDNNSLDYTVECLNADGKRVFDIHVTPEAPLNADALLILVNILRSGYKSLEFKPMF